MSNLGVNINVNYKQLQEAAKNVTNLKKELRDVSSTPHKINIYEQKAGISDAAFGQRSAAASVIEKQNRILEQSLRDLAGSARRSTWRDKYRIGPPGGGAEIDPNDTGGGGIGGGGGRAGGFTLGRAMRWGLAAAGGFSLLGFIGASRAKYQQAISHEDPLWARGIRNYGRGDATGLGISPMEHMALMESISQSTGLNDRTGIHRATRLSEIFAKSQGMSPDTVAGFRASIYQATGNAGNLPNSVLMSLTSQGIDKSKMPELLQQIQKNTGVMAQAQKGGGINDTQMALAAYAAVQAMKSGKDTAVFAKSGEFTNIMQNGLQSAGTAAGDIMLFKALGGYQGEMSWGKLRTMRQLKEEGFLANPGILKNLIGDLPSGSAEDRAEMLATMFPQWGLSSKTSLMMVNAFAKGGVLSGFTGSKDEMMKRLKNMATGGDAQAKSLLAEIEKNPALAKQSLEAQKEVVEIKAGEKLNELFGKFEKGAYEFANALMNKDWKGAFATLGKTVSEMGTLGKILLAAGGLQFAGGALSFLGGIGKGGGALMGLTTNPLGWLVGGGLAALGINEAGRNNGWHDKLTPEQTKALSGKTGAYSKNWIPYKDIFDAAAEKYRVDKNLVYAIAREESGFKPNSISPKGAVGLMQLMPKTAKEFGVGDITDVRDNVFGGVKYLSYLLKEFDGNADLAIAAYNGGPTRLKSFGLMGAKQETRDYLHKVKRSYEGYSSATDSVPQAMSTSPAMGSDGLMQSVVDILTQIAANTWQPATAAPAPGHK